MLDRHFVLKRLTASQQTFINKFENIQSNLGIIIPCESDGKWKEKGGTKVESSN